MAACYVLIGIPDAYQLTAPFMLHALQHAALAGAFESNAISPLLLNGFNGVVIQEVGVAGEKEEEGKVIGCSLLRYRVHLGKGEPAFQYYPSTILVLP